MQSKITAVIIEDEEESYYYLKTLLNKNFKHLEIIGWAKEVSFAINLIDTHKPEIVFLDIQIQDGDGFDVLNRIKPYEFEVIFTTGYDNFYQKAMEHYAFQYLLKPINEERLIKTLSKYQTRIESYDSIFKAKYLNAYLKDSNSKLLLHAGNNHILVEMSQIIKCTAEGNFTFFHFEDGSKTLISKSLKYFEELLITKGFFRANRFCIINISKIKSIYKKESIVLNNTQTVHVSVRNKSKLIDLIKNLS